MAGRDDVGPDQEAGSRQEKRALAGQYRTSGFFVLRTPLLPAADFAAWSAEATNGGGDGGASDHLCRSLTRRLAAPHAADALRVASPALADRCDGWADRKPSRRRERMERTLVQYFARMCDRCTPFGLFAGVSVGRVGAGTSLRLAGRERYRRRSTLDLGQVSRLVASLLRDEEVRTNLRYRTNDTLARVPGGYQYVEAKERSGETRHTVAFLEADEALSAVLSADTGEPRPLSEFRAALAAGISDPDVREADIRGYLDDLIEELVLLPELIPAVVGADPLEHIRTALEAAPGVREPTRRIVHLQEALGQLDAQGVGASPEAFAVVQTIWTEELGQPDTDRLLQVDMFKEATGLRLSDDVIGEALRGAEALWRLAGPFDDPLRDLKRRFQERYEAREVPLAEAFDPERGLGIPGSDLRSRVPEAPLLAGLGLAAGQPRGDHPPDRSLPEALANRLLDPGPDTLAPLELDDALLDRLAPVPGPELPDALALHFDLVATSEEAVRCGDYRIVHHGAAGPSGARMLGRFCDLDPVLLERVRGHLREEEALAPDDIFAEIVHSPEGRLGNVVRRPHVREVELSCAGHSLRDRARRLTVDDLLVRLAGGRFVLRSRRDGRTVRPRLTSAHNFWQSPGMYRFLCALQNDGIQPGFGWDWGLLDGLAFLPRVTRGQAVYALARWKVGRERRTYEAMGKSKTPGARDRALAGLVEELRLPRFVRLADGDHRLLLDLDNPLCRAVLADHAARRPALMLEETLADDLEGCVTGPEGKYRNEIILPIVRKRSVSSEGADAVGSRAQEASPPVRRVFTPGSEWLYLKLYAAPVVAQRLLAEVVTPLVALHREMAPEEPWFFLRYADPETHLRLRFRGGLDSRRALEDRAHSLIQPFVEAGSIARVGSDTYVREVERYGGVRGVEMAERWFRRDSEAVLRLLERLDGEEDEYLLWKAVAMGFDRLFADFGLDLEARERVASAARASYGQEFGVGVAARRRLGRRLRSERRELEALVRGDHSEHPHLDALDQVFRERSGQTAEPVAAFRRLDEAGELACPLDDLLRSLAHMHANRMFPVSRRAQEMVIHDFLSRTYRSLRARKSR